MTLTQVQKAGLDEIALDHVFTIGASGTDHYTFQGEGLNGTVNDPTLYLTRGKTYRFENSTGAHAIRIQSADDGTSGTLYSTGVTNNNTTGTVIVEVQHDAPDVLYYQCASHANMKGTIYITGALADGLVTTTKIADEAVTLAKLEHGTSSNDGKFLRANNGADPTFETVTGTTINNNGDNRVITGSASANTLEAESSVVINADGKLGVGHTTPGDFDAYADRLVVGTTSGNNGITIVGGSTGHSSLYFADGTSGGSQKNAGIVDYNHSTDSMRFATSATDAMGISSAGIVTKPLHPSFNAHSGPNYWTHGSDTGTLNITTINTELFDIGGNYDATNCIFTAPVTGKYFFSLTYAYICTSGYLNIHLKKGVSGSYSTYGRMFNSPPQQSGHYGGPPVIGIIELNAGNTVRPQAELNYSGNELVNLNFSGYLIG